MGFLPVPVVVWSWVRWLRHGSPSDATVRTRLTTCSMVLTSASCLLLAVFTGVLHYLESAQSDSADSWYTRSVTAGLFIAVGGVVLSPFTVRQLRLVVAAPAILLVGLWFTVGALY